MVPADIDLVTALLTAPDPVRVNRPERTRADAERWIEWQQHNYVEHDFGLWVLETHDGDFVGDCGLTVQDVEGTPYVETDWHVLPRWRGHGLATEAAYAVRDTAAASGIEHLIALIRPTNTPSRRVATKIGMSVERSAYVHGGRSLVYGMALLAGG